MTFETILFDVSSGVATITLNRPDKLNAFIPAMNHDVMAAIRICTTDDSIRAVILTGAGRGFCAGQDLGERAAHFALGGDPPDVGETLDTLYNPLVRAIRALKKPVVVAVNGVAAGAGANLALNGDIVIAARSAKFIEAFCKVGLIPDVGGTWHLPRLVGRSRSLGMALLGHPVSAEQACEWGLIWAVADDDALITEATAIAQQLAAGPTKALGAMKQAFNASESNTLEAQLDLERDTQRIMGQSDDYREGVTAFTEKRKADFKGR